VLTAVIGLALQDTLGNLLSGIALQLESSISIGDWIRVDDRAIGKILEIRWRSTLIQTKNGDLIIIPNGLFTKGVITNFNKSGLENRRWVYFNVHPRHPPNLVQQAVLEAIRGTPNVSERTPADCIVWSYEDSFIKYAVRYRLIDFLPDDPTDSEVRKRIWYALSRHGLEIPYPSRNIYVTELDAARDQAQAQKELVRRRDSLARVDLFRPLSDDERQHLVDGMRRMVFGGGELILRAGDPGDSLYLIRSGQVAVRIGVDGLEKDVAVLGEGQFFGEASLLTGEPRRATVVAKSDAECYVIDRELFQHVMKNNASLAEQIGKLLAERMRDTSVKREGLSAEAARLHEHQAILGRIKSFFGLS
jgi:CRP-like cAMP-binding protein